MANQHLRAEAYAEERFVLLKRNRKPVGLGLYKRVWIIGAHWATEHDGAGMRFERARQAIAENRAADIQGKALLDQHLAHATRA
ncbi:hypothetical protein GCM10007920_17030 [Ciceribacter naphthalenivorans]|uniref:Uncharacterized protein n=1 Tax=Sphingomonas psychrolutea TaxID=1259676 RepID=A0ABQ6EAX7_9SPHN|nr:hypothetical protein GCM10007920_17030 [Ciceribacter naphthalenivorans]GLT04772.1 hypothetical protein GCM10007926_17030 [Sphingomonas psychrolutea]